MDNPNKIYSVSVSGGKDSEVTLSVWNDVVNQIDFKPKQHIVFMNTSNEVADVYKQIKQIPNVEIVNPKVGWRQWIKENNYLFPTVLRRSCCSTYKEGQIDKYYNKNDEVVQVLGVRKYESTKRSEYVFFRDYDWEIKHYGSTNFSKKWVKVSPIIDIITTDIWLLMFCKNLNINQRYKYGSQRVGCLICPYSSSYEDELYKKYYPNQWEWFVGAIKKNYEIGTAKRHHWTLQEWINGEWKNPQSKYHKLISLKPTKENIHKLATEKGISDNMAAKYFNRVCTCGKKLTEQEIAMFYKTYGRYEDIEDNRNPICSKCYCKENNMDIKEYKQKINEFYEEGCNLF